MQEDNTTQEIEERLSERLLGSNDAADYNVMESGFRIDGSNSNINNSRSSGGVVDISATALMDGDILVDATGNRGGFGGPVQPEYRDAPFALAFLIHLGVVVSFAVTWGFSAFSQYGKVYNSYNDKDDDDTAAAAASQPSLSVLMWLALLTCAISIGLSALSLRIMMHHAETLIQASLVGSCCFLGIIAIMFLLSGAVWLAAGCALVALWSAWYAKRVWIRIPFASSNLRTALSAIQTNGGVCAVAYGVAGLAVVWTMIWSLAVVGVTYKHQSRTTCDSDTYTDCTSPNIPMFLFLMLSFYWTIQVFQNILHVTVSGVVGTWWFAPHDALSVFSPAIVDSFRRATTYSFGSICMGSLLVSVIQTLETTVRSAKKYNRGYLLTCLLECILNLLGRIAIYFNRWAYCYVGLYGFDYISSGRKAMELFRAKGWTMIITDDLVHRSLRLVTVVVGATTGFLGMLLGQATGWTSTAIVFTACFVMGLSMATILMNVVLSAVDTVIVAFAEAPAEFQTHHPALSNNMVAKWRQVFPDECGF
eukprot:CAMPEP_0116156666 /NCGR_PEP_ID=MMETSP0329-20121206/22950_1 /TAXON_ID=697910 /ORGANISM="Pseudo-nitzschia arenysensis, Strain B593" /LENGTH=534 /DNA_ID=CAMNT_0003653757 /DNA_START=168 /DNA_END=1772 /DNA_ORIENTATION=-